MDDISRRIPCDQDAAAADGPAAPDLRALFDAAGDRNALAQRCGWGNLDKGRRRLQALADGDLRLYPAFRERVARGLALDVAVVDAAAAAMRARQDEAAARAFVPHVIWRTEHSRPTSITLAVMAGMVGRLRFQPRSRHPLRMLAEAVAHCPEQVPFFGRVDGFVINYRPDLSIAFDRRGRPLSERDRSVRSGRAAGMAARLQGVVMSR